MKPRNLFLAAGLAALVAVPVQAQVTDTARMGRDSANPQAMAGQRMTDTMIVQQLIEANQKEVAAAREAQEHAESGRVKELARTIEQDHSAALETLVAYARAHGGMAAGVPDKGYAVNPGDSARVESRDSMPVAHRDSADRDMNHAGHAGEAGHEYEGKTGREFDEAFLRAQINAHQREIAHLRNDIIPMINDSELKNLVQGMLPTLGKHLRLAQQAQSQLD